MCKRCELTGCKICDAMLLKERLGRNLKIIDPLPPPRFDSFECVCVCVRARHVIKFTREYASLVGETTWSIFYTRMSTGRSIGLVCCLVVRRSV